MKFFFTTFASTLALISTLSWSASKNYLKMNVSDKERCFITNEIPDQSIGKFPTRGNPNLMQEQQVNVCMPLKPAKGNIPIPIQGTIGIAMNGVQFRPNTAGFWDPRVKQGHSHTGDKNWNLDIFGAPGKLSLDFNNGHVGRGGLYHYHGIAKHLLSISGSSLVGHAGDGFEIHYHQRTKKLGDAADSLPI